MADNEQFVKQAVKLAGRALIDALDDELVVSLPGNVEQVIVGQSHSVKTGGTFSLTLVATWTPEVEDEAGK